jgi:hypothetical protein
MKKISILCIGLLSLIACKKTETPAPTTTGGGGGTPTGNYAVFSSRKATIITNTLVSNQANFSNAYVSNTTLVNDDPMVGSLLDMGNVSLNGTTFQKDAYGAQYYYGDSTTNTYSTPHNWIVTGSNAVPSFSFANTTPYPVYTGYTAITDSFVIASGISIPLTNYSGADIVETYFATMTNPATLTSIQKLTNTPTTLNFTASDLSTIGAGKTVSLVINFYKNNVQVINGKNYNFRTAYEVVKSNIKFK